MAAMTMAAANMLPNNSMNFTENQHGHAVLDTLRHQREQNAFCDVILHVQGQQFEAHRCVLAACSKYFQTMFKQEKVVKEQLTISCGGHEIFKCLLDYIYTGNVVIDKHNVSELVRLSNHFNVLKLRGHCSEYLERYLDVTNCLSVMDMAGKYQMTELLRTAVAFVRHNIDEVLRQHEAMELPHNKVEMLIMDKELGLSPERQLTFILDWVRHSVSSRENDLRQLLVSAPLQLVERGRLLQLVQTDRLLAESERCLYFTLQSLADAGVRLPAYEQLFSQMEEKYMQDLVVDNDTFMSMAISTAIEELEGTEATIFDGLHRLQQQAAVSSNQNPPPIEMFPLGFEDALGGGGGGGGAAAGGPAGSGAAAAEVAPPAEQETARDLRCHGAAEPRYQGRYQDLLPPSVRYQEYQETPGDAPPAPPSSTCAAAPTVHDKYQELGTDGDMRYGAAVSEHARAAPRAAARYRSVDDCHEMAGAYGAGAALVPATSSGIGGSGVASVGDVQYMMVIKRPDNPDAVEKLTPVGAADGEDRRVDQGQTLGIQYMVYEYADPGGGGGGGDIGSSVYCEQPGALAQCRFEPPRRLAELGASEPLPGDTRYPPPLPPPPVESRGLQLSTRQSREQAACYLPADSRVPYEPGTYVCETAALEPIVPATGAEPAGGLLYEPADGRRLELAKLEPDQQDRFVEEQGRFGEGLGRFGQEQRRLGEEQGRLSEEQGRFEQPGQGRFGRMGQERFGEVAEGRFVATEQGRFGDIEQSRQMEQARFEQLEQTRFEQAELARFEQSGQARVDDVAQVFVDQQDQLRFEPPAAQLPTPPPPPPPPPPPLPMPAKKRKLDPGLAEELRNIHEQELRAIHEQDQQALHEAELRALHEPEYQTISDQELRTIQEGELRAGHGYEMRPAREPQEQEREREQELRTAPERGLEICEQEHGTGELRPDVAGPAVVEPVADALLNVNLSPKKKRLRRQIEPPPPPPAAKAELDTAETTDLAPLLAVPPAPPSPEQPPPPPPPLPRTPHHACTRCQSVFAVRSALTEHMAEKHRPGVSKKTFMCNICETACDKKSLYVKHMLTHFDGPPYTCSICFREFSVFPKFLRHRREHGENKPHRCADCSLSFWKKCNLDHHMRIHTGEKPFRCEVCGAAFALSTTLKQHMNRHSTEKKHFCDECNFSTKYANHLISHKKIHAGDLHHCSHAGCNYTTPKRSHLREHLQSHAKRRSHHCPQCHCTFNVKTHLSRHMRTHDETKKYRCSLCDYTVHRSDRLKSHMATHTRQMPRGRKPRGRKHKGEVLPPPTMAEVELPTQAPLTADWTVF